MHSNAIDTVAILSSSKSNNSKHPYFPLEPFAFSMHFPHEPAGFEGGTTRRRGKEGGGQGEGPRLGPTPPSVDMGRRPWRNRPLELRNSAVYGRGWSEKVGFGLGKFGMVHFPDADVCWVIFFNWVKFGLNWY